MHSPIVRFAISSLIAVSWLLPIQQSHAMHTGVKSMGMAGAVIAHPIDSLVAAYNPGGLGFIGNRWDLGVHWVNLGGEATFQGNEFTTGKFNSHHTGDNLFIPEFGVNKYTCECGFTWGFAIYNRSFFKTEYEAPMAVYGTTRPGLEYGHYVAAITGSVIIACDHCIGITADFHGQRLKVNGLQNFDTPEYSSRPGRVTNHGYEYSGGIGGTIGWMSRVSDNVSIGAAWSPMVKMSRFHDYRGLVARKGRVNIPQRFAGGVAIEMLCGLHVTFDIEHIKYNQVTPLENPLLPALGSMQKHRLLGEKKGSGLGWRDQTIFRFGAEWQVNETCSMRAGYWYHRDPIKSTQTFANALLPNVTESAVTWGGSWFFGPCDELSFYGGYAFRSADHGKSSIPDFLGGGEVNLEESRWMAGFNWARFF